MPQERILTALDPLVTSLVGIAVGAVGVIAHTGAHYLEGALERSREHTLVALFFAFLSGFLFPWSWAFASPLLLETTAFPGPLAGALWGGFLWVAFILPVEIAHVVWGREDMKAATPGLGAWLAQLLLGGALAGLWILP